MSITTNLIHPNERKFLPNDFTVSSWAELESYYLDLYKREINSFDDFLLWFRDWDELNAVVGEDMRKKYIRTSIDTADQEAKQALEKFYTEIDPEIQPWENKLQTKFNNSEYKTQLSEDFKNIKRGVEKDLSLFTEKNIELNKELSLMENEYAEITGAWSIQYEGKELTIPQASVFFKKLDRKVREEVFRAINDREIQDADKLDELLSDLIEKRHQLALNAGYTNYRDYMFDRKHRFDYTVEDCEDFQESVSSAIVPLLKEMDLERKSLLGYEDLRAWDAQVDPEQNAPLQPFSTTEEFVAKTVECFNSLDPYFGTCISNMYEIGNLDLESRKSKAPGGYMMSMPESGIPFIFMNHASSEGDVRVMVHEGGHAIHSFLDFEIPYAGMRQTPSEVAELASMTMELFSLENWEHFYDDEEELKRAKKNHLQSLLKLLPSVARGDEFQHWMYTNPTHTVAERRAKWMELLEKYGTGVFNKEGLEHYLEVGYQNILHFYQVPFYYIEYGFAQLGAIAMWRNYKKDAKKAIEDYKAALSLGYTRTIPEIYETAGISFDFSETYVKNLADFVQEELRKL